mgnify:CR=1 FL=1
MIVLHDNQQATQGVCKNKGSDLRSIKKASIDVRLGHYLECSGSSVFSFFHDEDKRSVKQDVDALVVKISSAEKKGRLIAKLAKVSSEEKKEKLVAKLAEVSSEKEKEELVAETGNYIGQFCWETYPGKSVDIEITSRFSNTFLQRMMNFANDIYLDELDDNVQAPTNNTALFVLYYLFIQSLEKAYLLGLPKSYETISYHEATIKGKVDINQFIRKDIPFKGKVSSASRERREVQEVVDVLYRAVSLVVEQYSGLKSRVKYILPHLKQLKSSSFVSPATVQKAKFSKALQNPMFYPYRKVLNFADMIIRQQSLHDKSDSNRQGVSFLINVAELFEIYITKLLQKEFPDWSVSSPKLEVYKQPLFFSRKIIPDIVMEKPGKVLVFDTKYKRMDYLGRSNVGMGDVDRTDFFQIHTYMSYYLPTHDVLAAGLLYPLTGEFDAEKCHSSSALGRVETQFVIDGVDVSDMENNEKSTSAGSSMETLISKEKEFIDRVGCMINK